MSLSHYQKHFVTNFHSRSGIHHDIATCNISFHVNHDLFKGFLLVPHQIEATSKRRDKVAEVEKTFSVWMKQIKIVVVQGNQIVYDGPDAGPQKELEHWRNLLTRFNYVIEFIESKPFRHHKKCLKLSRSKLVEVRKSIEWL